MEIKKTIIFCGSCCKILKCINMYLLAVLDQDAHSVWVMTPS